MESKTMLEIMPNVDIQEKESVNPLKLATREDVHKMLMNLPENESLFKCGKCRYIFDVYSGGLPVLMALSIRDGVRCPNCGDNNAELVCNVDGYSLYLKLSGKIKCREETIISGTDLCPVCKRPMCPKCYNHTVLSLSRVTGYMQDISGWNMAKRQELMDRKRYSIL